MRSEGSSLADRIAFLSTSPSSMRNSGMGYGTILSGFSPIKTMCGPPIKTMGRQPAVDEESFHGIIPMKNNIHSVIPGRSPIKTMGRQPPVMSPVDVAVTHMGYGTILPGFSPIKTMGESPIKTMGSSPIKTMGMSPVKVAVTHKLLAAAQPLQNIAAGGMVVPIWDKVFQLGEHRYRKDSTSKDHTTCYYVCTHDYKKVNMASACLGRCNRKYDSKTGLITCQITKGHTCNVTIRSTSEINNILQEQRDYIEDNIVTWGISTVPWAKRAREVVAHFQEKYKNQPVIAMSVDQVWDKIMKAKAAQSGTDWRTQVTDFPMGALDPTGTITGTVDTRAFVHFVSDVLIPDQHGVCKVKHTIVGMGHPDLLFRLRLGPVHASIDGTFDCVPKPFVQVLILYAYDEACKTWYPAMFILLTCKLGSIYTHVFRMIELTCGGKKNIRTKKLCAGKPLSHSLCTCLTYLSLS